MQRSIRTFSIALGAAIATLGFSGFASASANAIALDSEQAKLPISYADLDLARAEHAQELYVRIERAARNLCHVTYAPSASALRTQRECEGKAIDEAVQSVGNANLTAVYVAKNGKRSMVASSR